VSAVVVQRVLAVLAALAGLAPGVVLALTVDRETLTRSLPFTVLVLVGTCLTSTVALLAAISLWAMSREQRR
jgi:hypothetical protein